MKVSDSSAKLIEALTMTTGQKLGEPSSTSGASPQEASPVPAKARLVSSETPSERCTYEHCTSPNPCLRFHKIGSKSRAGERDWSSLDGQVLCDTCYKQFKRKGSLKRTQHKPLSEVEKRCVFASSERPHKSKRYHQIDANNSGGGKDWSSLDGKVLCHTCYNQFLRKGSLERARLRSYPLKSTLGKDVVPALKAAECSIPSLQEDDCSSSSTRVLKVGDKRKVGSINGGDAGKVRGEGDGRVGGVQDESQGQGKQQRGGGTNVVPIEPVVVKATVVKGGGVESSTRDVVVISKKLKLGAEGGDKQTVGAGKPGKGAGSSSGASADDATAKSKQ